MSDLLNRLKKRQQERISISKKKKATVPTCPEGQEAVWIPNPSLYYGGYYECQDVPPPPNCLETDKPVCPEGYMAKCLPDYYGALEWRCVVDPNYVPPDDDAGEIEIANTILKPEIIAGEKFPNIGTHVSQVFGEKVTIQNIFRMRVQMGDEYGKTKGWYKVIFPQEVIGARVIAASGPRSAEVSADTLQYDRRANYITSFSNGVGDAISLFLRGIIPNLGIEPITTHNIIRDIIDPMATELSKIYGSFIFDFVVKPQMDITKDLVGATFGKLTDSWGIERGRSVHNVDIRNITNTSFEWYAYGEQYINWIAIGLLPTDEETPLPSEIAQPVDAIKTKIEELQTHYDEQLQSMQAKIQDLYAKLGKEPPTTPILPERKRLFLPKFDRFNRQ